MTRTELKQEIEQKSKELSLLKEQERNFVYNELKEQYKENFKCDNCRYIAILDFKDKCTYCIKNHCYLCNKNCEDFKPHTQVSQYLREKFEHGLESIVELLEEKTIIEIDDKHFDDLTIALEILDKITESK